MPSAKPLAQQAREAARTADIVRVRKRAQRKANSDGEPYLVIEARPHYAASPNVQLCPAAHAAWKAQDWTIVETLSPKPGKQRFSLWPLVGIDVFREGSALVDSHVSAMERDGYKCKRHTRRVSVEKQYVPLTVVVTRKKPQGAK